jgi:hypothetical protein
MLLCLHTFGQLDYKTERKIRAEEDSLRAADTRKTFRMIKSVKWGFLTTFAQGNHSTLGLGFNRLVTGSVGHWGLQLNYEKILDNSFQGLNFGIYGAAQSSGIFNHLCVGLNSGVYSDLSSTNFVCYKPEIGFEYLHCILTYSYTWSTPTENKMFQNSHALNFKYYLTFYRKKHGLLYDF